MHVHFVYRILNDSGEKPTGKKKWDQQFLMSKQEWERINLNVFNVTSDRRIQWLQYRINHKILTTNTFLKKIKKIDNDSCSFCNRESETLEHLFYECVEVNTFLTNVYAWFNDFFSLNIVIDKKKKIVCLC